eukprot:UN09354
MWVGPVLWCVRTFQFSEFLYLWDPCCGVESFDFLKV